MTRFDGKIALIAGATSGIGLVVDGGPVGSLPAGGTR